MTPSKQARRAIPIAGAGIVLGSYDLAAISVAFAPIRSQWHLSTSVVTTLGTRLPRIALQLQKERVDPTGMREFLDELFGVNPPGVQARRPPGQASAPRSSRRVYTRRRRGRDPVA